MCKICEKLQGVNIPATIAFSLFFIISAMVILPRDAALYVFNKIKNIFRRKKNE